jgi:hypothetical protein
VANGGTGASTANDGFNALAPSQTGNSGKVLTTDGTNTSWATNGSGTVTSVATGTGLTGGPITTSGTISIDSTVATLTGTQTLTNKTLTAPTIDLINDTNGNEILGFSPTTSAVDYLKIKNGIGVGVPLHVYADGSSASIGLHIQPKGTGLVTISDGTDFNKGIRFRSSSSAASAITLLDAVATAGRVVTLPDATTTLVGRDTTDTLTNKSISGTTNTLSNIGNASLTNSAITINGTNTSLGGSISVGTITSVTGTAPVVSSGGNTPAISMAAANTTTNGYLTSTDWNTFNGKSNTNGTVTSVAALTIGTTGTDLSSTVATGTTTPVITLQVPTASATNRGALSAADWTTFNNKGSGTVTSVTGTAPVVSSGGATPAISMAAATTSVNGYLTSTDWTTFNGKYSVGGALGTPSSATLTNATGLPVGGITATGTPSSSTYLRGDGAWATVSASSATNLSGGALGSVPYQLLSGTTTFLAGNTTTTPQFLTSTGVAGIATAPTYTGSTGSGNVVLATSPTLVTPALGTPSAINLTNATGLGYGAMPAGSVLQVVQYSTESTVSTTSSSFTDVTSFSLSITPKFSTSKILVLTTLNGVYHNAAANQAASFRVLRGATQIAVTLNVSYSNTSIDWQSSSTCLNYLDSPATTSATTYKLQWYSRLGNTVQLNATQDTSTLILMEIAG